MFGILRPCRHRLTEELRGTWWAHLCGMCLALRDEAGQLARVVTNYDGLAVSALVEAQTSDPSGRRTAGPCPLRGMRTASVSHGAGARLAASASLVLASAKLRDHVTDGDAPALLAAASSGLARRWSRQGAGAGSGIGLDTAVVLDAIGRQGEVESALRVGSPVLLATEPTETATAEVFAHTAVLAGRPGNVAPLREAGRLFGRVAHLLDAVEDQTADAERGAWNPLTATGTGLAEARRLCDDAVLGVRLALREVEFDDDALVHALLVHELRQAVVRTFGHTDLPHGSYGPQGPRPQGPPGPGHPGPHSDGPEKPGRGGLWGWPSGAHRGLFTGCAAVGWMCCTCQFCCLDPVNGPWSGQPRNNPCACDCSGCDCCDCDCCDGCDCCGCDCS